MARPAENQITFTMDKETFDRIDKVAKREHISRGQVVRDCIKMGLSAREKFSFPELEMTLDEAIAQH